MLTELLHPASIELAYPHRRKHQVIEQLVALAGRARDIADPAALVREILKRDSETSTAIGDGVAIPHRLTAMVQEPVMAFLQTRKPAGFSTPDGIPVHLCFLLLAPEGATSEHLRTLSKLARILHDAQLRQALVAADRPEAVLAMIREHQG